jgi:hypothetical protein
MATARIETEESGLAELHDQVEACCKLKVNEKHKHRPLTTHLFLALQQFVSIVQNCFLFHLLFCLNVFILLRVGQDIRTGLPCVCAVPPLPLTSCRIIRFSGSRIFPRASEEGLKSVARSII